MLSNKLNQSHCACFILCFKSFAGIVFIIIILSTVGGNIIKAIVDTNKYGNGGALWLRDRPMGSKICKIPNKAIIDIDSLNGEWLSAQYKNYQGFVMAKYIENSECYNHYASKNLIFARLNTDDVIIRNAPNGRYALGLWHKNRIALCEKVDNYYKVRYKNKFGFIKSKYMTELSLPVSSSYKDRINTIIQGEIGVSKPVYFDGASGAWCQYFVNWILRASLMPINRIANTGNTGLAIKFWVKNASFYFKNSHHKERINKKYSLGLENKLSIDEQKYIPEPCDIIYFKWNSSKENVVVSHVGIVQNIDKNFVYTVEGNASYGKLKSEVMHKKYPLNDTRIVGYAKPNYKKEH